MFRDPDFSRSASPRQGNHDNRGYEDDWGEKSQGLLVSKPDGSSNYDSQANQNLAVNLKGKLLLGTDDGQQRAAVQQLLVVDALIKANEDFDLITFPSRGHGFANEPYKVRRRWERG